MIRNVYCFQQLSVNGKPIKLDCSFGIYIKEEVDETKVQYGRLKLHYPSKFIYEDENFKINNKEVYKAISNVLNNYAFLITGFEYSFDTDTLNFDALIVGENNIPYSKVFVNEKGAGNKFNYIFNESADDYDREIISLRKTFGQEVNPFNYLEYSKIMKESAINLVKDRININLSTIYDKYPYSIFDFFYFDNGVKKYGFLRVTATKNHYFNLSIIQQIFMSCNQDDCLVFLVSDIFGSPELKTYNYKDLSELYRTVNSVKFEGE
jgi:hypothetical protein